jgi:hypothetical protein
MSHRAHIVGGSRSLRAGPPQRTGTSREARVAPAILVLQHETPTPHWEVRREGSLTHTSRHQTLVEALSWANAIAERLGGEVILRRREGEGVTA